MSRETERIFEWGFKTAIGVCFAIIAYFGSTAFEQLQDHEVRLSRREANAFTSQDANELLIALNRLTFQVDQQRKELDETKKQRDALLDQMRRFESKFSVLPEDVLNELKELRKDLNTL